MCIFIYNMGLICDMYIYMYVYIYIHICVYLYITWDLYVDVEDVVEEGRSASDMDGVHSKRARFGSEVLKNSDNYMYIYTYVYICMYVHTHKYVPHPKHVHSKHY